MIEAYVWTLPLLFIFHDMEEIIGFILWYEKNKKMLEQRYPKINNIYNNISTEGFAFAVFEELICCIAICIISLISKEYGLWLGGLIGCSFHFMIHIVQAFIIKKYIPAVVTSSIALPIGCFIIYESIGILKYSIQSVLIYSVMGLICILLNLKFAHTLMKKFSAWQYNKRD